MLALQDVFLCGTKIIMASCFPVGTSEFYRIMGYKRWALTTKPGFPAFNSI